MSERGCTRSKITSRPSGEMSESRILKSSGTLVGASRSALVSRFVNRGSSVQSHPAGRPVYGPPRGI